MVNLLSLFMRMVTLRLAEEIKQTGEQIKFVLLISADGNLEVGCREYTLPLSGGYIYS
jgi:hypothetical protein